MKKGSILKSKAQLQICVLNRIDVEVSVGGVTDYTVKFSKTTRACSLFGGMLLLF